MYCTVNNEFIYLPTYLPVCLSVYMYIYICMCIYICIYISIYCKQRKVFTAERIWKAWHLIIFWRIWPLSLEPVVATNFSSTFGLCCMVGWFCVNMYTLTSMRCFKYLDCSSRKQGILHLHLIDEVFYIVAPFFSSYLSNTTPEPFPVCPHFKKHPQREQMG